MMTYSNEKLSEHILSLELEKEEFNKKHLFYSPFENDVLRNIFECCSKNNTDNIGIPDRIYFDGNTIIVFECKKNVSKTL